MQEETLKKVVIVLRMGVAFAFLYPAIKGFIDPDSWIGYFPAFFRAYVPTNLLLGGFAVTEIIIALWILSGKKIFVPSVIASIMLIGIIIFNLSEMDVIFRDITILAATTALALASYAKKPPMLENYM